MQTMALRRVDFVMVTVILSWLLFAGAGECIGPSLRSG
jgi:hypothetical protein